MEENKELNYDEIIGKIKENTSVKELIVEGVPEETAELLLKAYKHGVDEYHWKYYRLNESHKELCVKVCEKLL